MIKWLEGYFISSKFDRDISIQSCSSNLRTPCTSTFGSTPPPQCRRNMYIAPYGLGLVIVIMLNVCATKKLSLFWEGTKIKLG